MYETFYGFRENPFHLPPDPAYVFMSEPHEEALTHLEYAVQANKGFVVITGEVGAGKTTLMNLLLQRIPQEVVTAVLSQTQLLPLEFLQQVCNEFEIDTSESGKPEKLEALQRFLLEQYQAKKRAVLLIDEAQNLPTATLEELRMLSNLTTDKEHLIQMILLGQPNLKDKLQRKGLEQFAQRVTVHYHLRGLNREETGQYIRHRLHVAGADNPELFTPQAMDRIFEASGGIPRLINILCDGALVYGYADGLTRIDEATVAHVLQDRNGLRAASPSPKEREPAPYPELLERLDALESHVERLGERIERHMKDLETRDRKREKRILERLEALLAEQGRQNAGHSPEAAQHPPKGPSSAPGLFHRLLNRLRLA
ncbi:MAG: AAA family ATPase [Desulfobacteraceae bacterium]|jgi:general secretion pathway protein A